MHHFKSSSHRLKRCVVKSKTLTIYLNLYSDIASFIRRAYMFVAAHQPDRAHPVRPQWPCPAEGWHAAGAPLAPLGDVQPAVVRDAVLAGACLRLLLVQALVLRPALLEAVLRAEGGAGFGQLQLQALGALQPRGRGAPATHAHHTARPQNTCRSVATSTDKVIATIRGWSYGCQFYFPLPSDCNISI